MIFYLENASFSFLLLKNQIKINHPRIVQMEATAIGKLGFTKLINPAIIGGIAMPKD